MGLKLVRSGGLTTQVDEETYAIVMLMIEDLPTPVHEADLAPIVQMLRLEGHHEAITIACAARDQIEIDNFWTDQALDDAYFAEHGVTR